MASLVASPTPLPHGFRDLAHRPSRSTLPRTQTSRPNLKRGSPLYNGFTNVAEQQDTIDSSDDEAPIPQLSAAAEELLGVRTGERPHQGGLLKNEQQIYRDNGSPAAKDTYQAPRMLSRTQRPYSPSGSTAGSPRIVRISSAVKTMSGSLRRAKSIAGTNDGSPLAMKSDLKTPAPRPKSVYQTGSASPGAGKESDKAPSSGSILAGASTVTRKYQEEHAVQGSIRVKRLGKVSGAFLSGPARRGMIRRQSEEDQVLQSTIEAEHDAHERNEQASRRTSQEIPYRTIPSPSSHVAEVAQESLYPNRAPTLHQDSIHQPASPDTFALRPLSRRPSMAQLSSRNVVERPAPLLDSIKKHTPRLVQANAPDASPQYDQENILHPTYVKDKPTHEALSVSKRPNLIEAVSKVQLTASPAARRVLSAKTNNTPLRPAPPPPPKMSILETATAPSVSAANAKRKPRNMISVNGKHFTRMECIGRGGSGRVYRVMAENFKLFAVKSVSLEDLDEITIRGFKGEIELLRKLQDVDRVVRLYDYEINEEKKVLRVLMDIGELDLKKILDPKLDAETGLLDITFTRYIWKEMLECVASVHNLDIVHSDLKPANFVMIQGRLKLIDFGIANAIQDDTVNVHREQQVGTPNYMSPETLIDTNVHNGKRTSGAGKLMKVGKPSDVWSLGCILYQIVYGKLPFAHITNHVRKAMAIIDPSHTITYPTTGLGGIPVPTGLIRTLRKCLDRDASRRPTVEQLLSAQDMFLHPDAAGTVPVSVELIGRLQHNIIQHIVAHGVPSEDELKIWPGRFFESIRAAVEEGRA